MALNLDRVRVIVFDLDGTVYDDNRHFELYAREIQSHLAPEHHDAFWNDYTATVEGRHPALRIGCLYDVERDLILIPKNGKILRALHWDGSEAPPVVRQQLYPDVVHADHQKIMNVGDLWWVPSAISAHYGGEPEGRMKAFLRIRDIMADPEFKVEPIPGLAETIEGMKGKVVQILATNSPQPDSEAILTKVGLLGHFDKVYFRSNKPAGLRPIFEEICAAYGTTMDGLLSVGDNLVNEIAPARAMGGQAVFIDPHAMASDDDAELVIQTMGELIPLLRQHYGIK